MKGKKNNKKFLQFNLFQLPLGIVSMSSTPASSYLLCMLLLSIHVSFIIIFNAPAVALVSAYREETTRKVYHATARQIFCGSTPFSVVSCCRLVVVAFFFSFDPRLLHTTRESSSGRKIFFFIFFFFSRVDHLLFTDLFSSSFVHKKSVAPFSKREITRAGYRQGETLRVLYAQVVFLAIPLGGKVFLFFLKKRHARSLTRSNRGREGEKNNK